ncbi:MAG: CsgG/HfaB family protein [Phycisphaeraceae bacterium]
MGVIVATAGVLSGGCATTGESGARDQVTANVGNYPMGPSGVDRPRVGVPPFSVETEQRGFSVSEHELDDLAADQMTTLLFRADRFSVIERAQLDQLLREQNLEGIVEPGELARMGRIRGVDYLLLGKVTAFRIRTDRTSQDAGVKRGWVSEQIGGITGGVRQDRVTVSTELGVDIRLVNPETGEVVVAEFSDFKREDTAESMGIDVAGVGAGGDADMRINADDAGKVLRLAFDDAIKKMLPRVDRMLRDKHAAGGATAAAAPTGADAGGEAESTAAKFCSQCGTELAAGARFCPEDGQPVQ